MVQSNPQRGAHTCPLTPKHFSVLPSSSPSPSCSPSPSSPLFSLLLSSCFQVRRLKEFGLTAGELTRYLTALLKDSEHVAALIGTIPSLDNLDFIMENDALGHVIMDQEQAYESLSAVAPTITLEEVILRTCRCCI